MSSRGRAANANACCHYCRISINRERKKRAQYICCSSCKKQYCSRCLDRKTHIGVGTAVAKKAGWRCACCLENCCCAYQECFSDHVHCFTYKRTKLRHSTGKFKWVKAKKTQIKAEQCKEERSTTAVKLEASEITAENLSSSQSEDSEFSSDTSCEESSSEEFQFSFSTENDEAESCPECEAESEPDDEMSTDLQADANMLLSLSLNSPVRLGFLPTQPFDDLTNRIASPHTPEKRSSPEYSQPPLLPNRHSPQSRLLSGSGNFPPKRLFQSLDELPDDVPLGKEAKPSKPTADSPKVTTRAMSRSNELKRSAEESLSPAKRQKVGSDVADASQAIPYSPVKTRSMTRSRDGTSPPQFEFTHPPVYVAQVVPSRQPTPPNPGTGQLQMSVQPSSPASEMPAAQAHPTVNPARPERPASEMSPAAQYQPPMYSATQSRFAQQRQHLIPDEDVDMDLYGPVQKPADQRVLHFNYAPIGRHPTMYIVPTHFSTQPSQYLPSFSRMHPQTQKMPLTLRLSNTRSHEGAHPFH